MDEDPLRRAWLSVPLLCLLVGCVAPATKRLPLDTPACVGTQPGNACLTLLFAVSDPVRQQAGERCSGFVHWGLYAGGDVGTLGPGNNPPLLGNSSYQVDLAAPGATGSLTLPNVTARSYQALGFISQQGPGHPSVAGDPVTLPSGTFDVPVNTHIQVTLLFNVVH